MRVFKPRCVSLHSGGGDTHTHSGEGGCGEKMPAARASILQRPLRTPHPSAGESAEREYQEEQARLQAKRERYQETETFVRTMLNPSATERRNFQYVIRYEIHLQKHFRFRRKEHRYLPPSLTSTRFLTFAPHFPTLCMYVSLCVRAGPQWRMRDAFRLRRSGNRSVRSMRPM